MLVAVVVVVVAVVAVAVVVVAVVAVVVVAVVAVVFAHLSGKSHTYMFDACFSHRPDWVDSHVTRAGHLRRFERHKRMKQGIDMGDFKEEGDGSDDGCY